MTEEEKENASVELYENIAQTILAFRQKHGISQMPEKIEMSFGDYFLSENENRRVGSALGDLVVELVDEIPQK